MRVWHSAVLAMACTAFFLMAGCGGGGGASNDASPPPPAAAEAPEITAQPVDQRVEVGQGASFSVTAANARAYDWQQSNSGSGWTSTGATGSEILLPTADLSMNGAKYRVVISGTGNSVTSDEVTLTVVYLAPTIVSSPSAQTINVGDGASFSAEARGTDVTLRWQVRTGAGGWTDIAGETSASLILNGPTLDDSGKRYRMVASNASGEVATDEALLTVNLRAGAFKFATQPVNTTIVTGQAARFSADVTGSGPMLQWQVSNDGTTWSDIAGARQVVLTTPADLAVDGNRFRAVARTASEIVTSAAATLKVVSTTRRSLSILAGQAGGSGNADGTGTAARFAAFAAVNKDSSGNIYVTDQCRVRKMTPSAVVSTYAGGWAGCFGSDASGEAIQLRSFGATAIGSTGDVFVSAHEGNAVYKIATDGIVTLLAGSAFEVGTADGTGSAARFTNIGGMAIDASGTLYVTDQVSHTVRKITAGGVVSTLAGKAGVSGSADGGSAAARFKEPGGLAVDTLGNIFVADSGNHTVRRIAPNGQVSTIAGSAGVIGSSDGSGTVARFNHPSSIAIDANGNRYISDSGNHTLRKIHPEGTVSTVAGSPGLQGSTDGTGSSALFAGPGVLAVDDNGNVFVADSFTVRKVTPARVVSTVAGAAPHAGAADGVGGAALFNDPWFVAADAQGNVYVADGFNSRVSKISPSGAVTSFFSGISGSSHLEGVAVDAAGTIFAADSWAHVIIKIAPDGSSEILAGQLGVSGHKDGTGTAALLASPSGLTIDATGNLFVRSAGTIRKITPSGSVTTVAGSGTDPCGSADGPALQARFSCGSGGLVFDQAGNLFIADDQLIRKMASDSTVTTLAGSIADSGVYSADGTGTDARFQFIQGLTIDPAGNLYVADMYNHTIRKITPSGVVSTIAGVSGVSSVAPGNSPLLNRPAGVVFLGSSRLAITSARENVVMTLSLP
jgi:sugar lactone lactonase YvrE